MAYAHHSVDVECGMVALVMGCAHPLVVIRLELPTSPLSHTLWQDDVESGMHALRVAYIFISRHRTWSTRRT